MIVIDSFKALHPYAKRDEDFRRFLHDLAGRLSAFPATSFWVGEYDQADSAGSAEFAVADPVDQGEYEMADARLSSGIPLLDQMLGRGYWPGASTLVAGPSGSGKTLMGLHFIFEGARKGEPGVIATLQENGPQLERIVNVSGWSLGEQSVELMYRTPVDLYLDEWVHELLDTA